MTGRQKISLPLHQCVVASDPKIVTLRAGCDVVVGAREDNDWERRSMQEFDGRTAFVTGGASGIGLAMARAFGRAGMQVMIADVEEQALGAAVDELQGLQIRADGTLCDVSQRDAVAHAARHTIETFGNVHVVCNNAGVGGGGQIGEASLNTWDWVLGVNLMGVVYGLQEFVPHMKAHGEGGHIVNTASMAGMINMPGMGPYNASKFAVVSMSETLVQELAPFGIGVSVLCPGWVRTGISDSERNRPDDLADGSPPLGDAEMTSRRATIRELIAQGLEPDVVGARVLEAVRNNELHIFTHMDMRPAFEERIAAISAAWDRAEDSPALNQGV